MGLTSTPPAHLKSRPVNIFSNQANNASGNASSGAGGAGEHSDADRLASAPRGHSAGSQGAPSQLSPTRSESPTFGPEAWTVGENTASGAGAPVVKSKPKRSIAAASSMR